MTGEETIRRPIEWWNKQIKLDWSKLLSVVARTALKTASAKFDDAWVEAVRGIEAVGLSEKNKPQVLAWLLIHKALARSVFVLLGEARARNPSLPYRIEGDGAAVIEAGRLMPKEVEVRRDFLTRPETLPFLGAVRDMLVDWFVDLGVPAAEARAMVGRLDGVLSRELREEWRADPAAWQPVKAWLETPFDDAVRRQDAWDRAISKITALPHESVFGEAFSLRDVYVPLRAYTVEQRDDRGRGSGGEKPKATLGWLHELIVSWIDDTPIKDDALRVISGGPGSGKSSAARMLAAELANRDDLRLLYVPLHRLRLGGVLKEGLAEYSRAWLFDDSVDPIDSLEPQRRLVLFLDGLDELTSSEDRAAHDLADQFARELRVFLDEQNRHRTRVLAIVGGRELAVQSTTEARFQKAPVLHVFPFEKGETLETEYDWGTDEDFLNLDQRPFWWGSFAAVTGAESADMPAAIADNPRLKALTELPLLNYLVASFARRHGARISERTSVADVYDALIRDVYERAWGEAEKGPTARDLVPRVTKPQHFLEVLEEVALAVWHGNGRGADLATIQAYLKAAELTGLIQEIRTKLEGGISNLLLTFFFRKDMDSGGRDYFEFTHKSFQEYLTARRILRAAGELAKAGRRPREVSSALVRWVESTGPAMVSHEIAELLGREAERQSSAAARRPVREALCFLFGYQLAEGLPVEDARGPAGTSKDHEPTRFGDMRQWSDRAEVALLAVIAALASRPHNSRPRPVSLRLPDSTSFKALLERLSLAEYRDNNGTPMVPVTVTSLRDMDPIVEPWDGEGEVDDQRPDHGERRSIFLWLADLSGAILTGTNLPRARFASADLSRADLSQVNLSRSYLRGASLNGSNITNSNLSGAVLSGANLSHADLSHADLSHADLSGADLSGADLSGADLSGANLSGAILIGTNLPRARFASADLSGADLSSANLSHADLSHADLSHADLSDANLTHTHLTGAKNLKSLSLSFDASACIAEEETGSDEE